MIFVFLAGQEFYQICGQVSLVRSRRWRLLCFLKVYTQEYRHIPERIGEVKLGTAVPQRSTLLNSLLLKTVHEEFYLNLLRMKYSSFIIRHCVDGNGT